MSDEQDDLTFESALEALETIVAQLEEGDLSLEASVALFERGQSLAAFCARQLEAVSLRVEQLTEDGEIVPVDVNAL